MRLLINGQNINCEIAQQSYFTSKHSLKQLEKLEVLVEVSGENQNKVLLDLIDLAKKKLNTVDNENNILKSFKLINNSYSYNDRSPIYTHTFVLEELENIEVSSLELNEMLFTPYFYDESFYKQYLTINAKCLITDDQQEFIINNFNEEITVIRHGIDERPRQMYLSYGVWSESDDGIKQTLILNDPKIRDKDNPISDTLVELFKSSRQSAINEATLDALLYTLTDKNIITQDELKKIYEYAEEHLNEKLYNFYNVKDID